MVRAGGCAKQRVLPPPRSGGRGTIAEERMAEGASRKSNARRTLTAEHRLVCGDCSDALRTARPLHHRLFASLGRRSPSRRFAGEVGPLLEAERGLGLEAGHGGGCAVEKVAAADVAVGLEVELRAAHGAFALDGAHSPALG